MGWVLLEETALNFQKMGCVTSATRPLPRAGAGTLRLFFYKRTGDAVFDHAACPLD